MKQIDQIGVAIIGTGFMGMAHAEALRRIGVRLVGCLGSSLEKSRSFAHRWNLAKAYASLDELLSDRDVNAVHVASPNIEHYSMARRAIEAGKHILCEKPLAMNSKESADLVALSARRPDLCCGVNYNVRYYPVCIEARERFASGDFGEVHHVCGSYVQDWLLEQDDYNWRVLASQGGELRAVADIGTHWMDLAQHITGLSVTEVCADLKTVHPVRLRPAGEVETFARRAPGQATNQPDKRAVEIDTDDYGGVLLRFSNGARGLFWVSQVTAGRKNLIRFEIAATRRAVAWNSEQPDELWIGMRHEANRLLLRDPALLTDGARRSTDYPGGHVEGYPDTFKQLFRAFYRTVAAEVRPATAEYPTFADGHREIVLCEAILASHRLGKWVPVNVV